MLLVCPADHLPGLTASKARARNGRGNGGAQCGGTRDAAGTAGFVRRPALIPVSRCR